MAEWGMSEVASSATEHAGVRRDGGRVRGLSRVAAALHYSVGGMCAPPVATLCMPELTRMVQVMYECKRSHSETLAEAIPETMKNVLLVMATRGVLSPAWTVSQCAAVS